MLFMDKVCPQGNNRGNTNYRSTDDNNKNKRMPGLWNWLIATAKQHYFNPV